MTPAPAIPSVAAPLAAELGDALRAAGLTARMLATWVGRGRVPVVAASLPALRAALRAREVMPAGVALALFVAGAELALERAARLPLDALLAAGLVERDAGHVRATVALLPVGAALVACDRADAAEHVERVCWPDDSSDHLAAAIPPDARRTWTDLACGSAFAQLLRPEQAAVRCALDANPRAVACARLGAALSRIAIAVDIADIGDATGGAIATAGADLVTCNAPMPGGAPGDPMWQRTNGAFFDRLFATLPDRLVRSPAAMAIVHARRDALPGALAALPGERVVVRYTPDGVPAFAVLWWRPHAPDHLVERATVLTALRPHVDAEDRAALLALTARKRS